MDREKYAIDAVTISPPATPVCVLEQNIFLKLEYLQIGGSHKSRAARGVILDAEKNGFLLRDDKHLIIEKTGGNFGVGLATHGVPRGYAVKLIVRPTFSASRQQILRNLGVELIGRIEMEQGATNQQIIDQYVELYKANGLVPYYSDQFNNPSCISAHEKGAREFVDQLQSMGLTKSAEIRLVKCVGSGASLCAYSAVFKSEFPNSKIIVVEPEGCSFSNKTFANHPFQGASVGVVPSFLEKIPIEEYLSIPQIEGITASRELFALTGVFSGLTTGLVMAGAKRLLQRKNGPIAIIAYDGGEVYAADALHTKV